MKFWRRVKSVFIPSEHNVYRPHVLSKPVLIFFLTVVLTAEGMFVADLLVRQSAINFLSSVLAGEVVAYTNDERSLQNLAQFETSALLTAAAQAKAEDMAAKGYFSHNGPDGKEPWEWITEAGYAYRYAGENLAVRFTDSREVVEAWMASPSHKANIVKSVYTQIGVGVAQGEFEGAPATFVVQYFGTPLAAAPVVADAGTPAPSSVSASTLPQPASLGAPQVEGVATAEAASGASASAAQEITLHTSPDTVLLQAPHSETPWSSFARELAQGDVQPSVVTVWILAGVATLLTISLLLAFFVHMQVQATDMLMGGAVVAVVALSFVALNMNTPLMPQRSSNQAAAVFGAVPHSGGFIDSNAAAVQAGVPQTPPTE